jgi:hypothetical protein
MPYTAQFFAEKLNVPVDYFNPFRNIEIAPDLDLEELSKYAHSFGEVVGLGLRDLAHCPVELNLMPKSSRQRQELNQKKPYFIAAIFSLVLTIFAIGWAENRIAVVRRQAAEQVKAKAVPLTAIDQELTRATAERDSLARQVQDLASQAETRTFWANVVVDIRRCLLQAEAKTKQQIKAKDNKNVEVGVWVEAFAPVVPSGHPFAVTGQSVNQFVDLTTLETMFTATTATTAKSKAGAADGSDVSRATVGTAAGTAKAGATNEIAYLTLLCRAVRVSPAADADLAYAVKEQIAACSWATSPIVLGDLGKNDTNTFTFPISVKLKRPFKL